jgi:hypothetical protein
VNIAGQLSPNSFRVETKDIAEVEERVRPLDVVGMHPIQRFACEAVASLRGAAPRLVNDTDGILENRTPEAIFAVQARWELWQSLV